MHFVAVRTGKLADGKQTPSYQVFQVEEAVTDQPAAAYALATGFPNDPVVRREALYRAMNQNRKVYQDARKIREGDG